MNWPATGVLAAIAIAVGIVLLVVYAVRRGLVDNDLPDTFATPAVPTSGPARVRGTAQKSRATGAAGALILVIGLALGLVTAIGGWGGAGGCAQSWNGCAQSTAPAQPSASTAP
ncbi:MAG: hypothetical protein ACYDAN_07200 [Candidatus Limnocylindrales bacterium]